MVYLAVDKDDTERMHSSEPIRGEIVKKNNYDSPRTD